MISECRSHWDSVYDAKAFTEVSWYQETPAKSLESIAAAGIGRDGAVLDAGGGASTLVDHLLEDGFTDLTVLDISAMALRQTKDRLGAKSSTVNWIVSDILGFTPGRKYDLWHDRAVLHFLSDPGDRERYVDVVRNALAHKGFLVLATFGPAGPHQCSGLRTTRYTVDMTAELLGPDFELQGSELVMHETPAQVAQQFLYSTWRNLK